MRINKVAAATLMPVLALGSLVALGGSASAGPRTVRPAINLTGQVTISPSKNLVNGQVITMHAKDFNTAPGTMLYGIECDPTALTTLSDTWCDTHPADSAKPVAATNGAGTLKFTILTGSSFRSKQKKGACGFTFHQTNGSPGSCYFVVSDTKTQVASTIVGFVSGSFKDTRVSSKTKLTGKKSAKVGSKVTFTATTKGKGKTKPTGKVVFKDGSKKCGSVAEKSSGKVKAKCTIKSGTNKITATYSGDVNFKGSVGKETVKGKK